MEKGPGEFTRLSQVHRWPGDSLLTLYSQARRLTVLDSEGNYGRDFALRRGRQFFSVEDILPGGAILTYDFVRPTDRPVGFSRLQHVYRVRGAEGEMRSLLGSFAGAEIFGVRTARGVSGGGLPFGHRVWALSWGDQRQVAATPEEERVDRQRELREFHGDRPMPETHPAYDAAMADLADHLWVREYHLPGEGGAGPVWTVFDPDGQILGFLETPAGLAIFEIGDDYILGLARDDLGVQSVQVWSLER